MKRNLKALALGIASIFTLILLTNCEREIIPGVMEFVGSENCMTCHSEKYNDWIASGHPYKFTVVENGQAPTFPSVSNNFQSEWISNLGDGSHTWDDIAGVIGGYGWKTRFVGTDGHVIGTAESEFSTGAGHNQINFFGGENHGWGNYHTDKVTIYNYSCFKCHTTGGDTTGSWLAGVDNLGTFSEGGIGCESCHGPGSQHVDDPTVENIDRVYEFAHYGTSTGGLDVAGIVQKPSESSDDVIFLCGTCHNRGYESAIDASGGFIKHHEQWEEFIVTAHYEYDMTCTSCHDPHKRTIWDGDAIKKTCTSCHSSQATTTNHVSGPTCIDCHMPFAAKSGTARGSSGFKGDVRSHLMTIIPNTESMFNDDGSAVRDDATRPAALSPAYACLGCHNDDSTDDIPDKTLAEAASGAANMHTMK